MLGKVTEVSCVLLSFVLLSTRRKCGSEGESLKREYGCAFLEIHKNKPLA